MMGREGIRLMVEGVRGSPECARFMEDRLRTILGVQEVTADPGTGSVCVRYEPPTDRRPGDCEIVLTVPEGVRVVSRASESRIGTVAARLAQTVAVVVVEIAVQRMLGPFFPRRC